MIINVRHAYSDNPSDFSIYTDEKISHFAFIGKKIRLFDKDGNSLIKKIKVTALGKKLFVFEGKKKSIKITKYRDSAKKIYYGILQRDKNFVYRVQIFQRDAKEYVLFTLDKKFVGAAVSDSEMSLYKLYVKDSEKELAKYFLPFILYYVKAKKQNKKPN